MERDRGFKRQRLEDGSRRRSHEEIPEGVASWRALVVRLGERCAEYGGRVDPADQLETCVTVLKRDLTGIFPELLPLLMQCAEELPHKSPLYATLVGLLNLQDKEFAAQVVDRTYTDLQAAMDAAECNRLRILLRFLSLLMVSKVVAPATVVEVFDIMLTSAAATVDEEGGNPAWQPRADFYVYCVLAALPFCAGELAKSHPEEVERLMAAVEAYMTLRARAFNPGLHCLSPLLESRQPEPHQDYLEDLLARIRSLQKSEWRCDSVPMPHEPFAERLETAQLHDMPSLTAPPVPPPPSPATPAAVDRQSFEALQLYRPRFVRLKIFPPSKTDEMMSPIDRFLVEEYITDVLFYLNGCRRECAAYLVGLPVPFRYEYVMAETIFSQLLLLPRPPYRLVYYTIIMVDLCKALPGAFPPVVAGAVKLLFARLWEMDVECRQRLVQWLSHHLSNFGWVWPWDEWAPVLEEPPWAAQRVFVAEVLEKEVRLGYWDKVKEHLGSEQMVALLPPKPNPSFKFGSPKEGVASETEVALSKELVGKVRSKQTVKQLQAWLEESVVPALGPERMLEVVVQTLLSLGAKSFTHTMTALERYGQLLHRLAPTKEKQVALIESAAELWQHSPQMAAVVVDRCMGFRLVSNLAIVAWAFSPPCQKLFHTSDRIWEILRNAINKTNNRTVDLRKEVLSVGKAAAAAAAAAQNARKVAEEAMAVVEAAEEEEAKSQATAKAEWAQGNAVATAEEAISAQETVEAKQFLLTRAHQEQEALFLAILRNFATILTERMAAMAATAEPRSGGASAAGAVANGREAGGTPMEAAVKAEPLSVEAEEDAQMEDQEEGREGSGERGRHKKERTAGSKEAGARDAAAANGGPSEKELHEAEERAWQEVTLGQLRSICRHYAAEIWPLVEKIDAEVLTDAVDRRVVHAAYEGLGRPFQSQ